MSDPSGRAPELTWPRMRRPTAPFQMVYLDLNHWIALAQAYSGHPHGTQFAGALSACRHARANRTAIFPLASPHYVEVSKIKDPRQRRDLQIVMEELSGFVTLPDIGTIKKLELDAVLDTKLSASPKTLVDYPVLGFGVGFAFGRPVRSQLVDAEGADVTDQLRQEPAYARLLDEAALLLERAVLAGPTDDEVAELQAQGWDPLSAWRIAEERAREEREQAARLDGAVDRDWRRGRLRDIVCAREMVIELRAALLSACKDRNLDVIEAFVDDRTDIRRLVRAMPSSEVSVELKTAMHRNAQRARNWSPNDVVDMDAMSLAMPYCDIVVTENHIHHALKAARLDVRMHTALLCDVRDLPRSLVPD